MSDKLNILSAGWRHKVGQAVTWLEAKGFVGDAVGHVHRRLSHLLLSFLPQLIS